MSNPFSSDIPLALPLVPLTKNPELRAELSIVYDAVKKLQQELSAAKKRISDLEAYNQAHP